MSVSPNSIQLQVNVFFLFNVKKLKKNYLIAYIPHVIAGPSGFMIGSYSSRSFLLTSSGMSQRSGKPSRTTSACLMPRSSRVSVKAMKIVLKMPMQPCVLCVAYTRSSTDKWRKETRSSYSSNNSSNNGSSSSSNNSSNNGSSRSNNNNNSNNTY